ncbi:hypothetical protein ACVWYN_000599 [Pedobacter sp. UYP24]
MRVIKTEQDANTITSSKNKFSHFIIVSWRKYKIYSPYINFNFFNTFKTMGKLN